LVVWLELDLAEVVLVEAAEVAVLVAVEGVVVWASMPGALGASARSLPTFLVPDAGAVPVVVEEVEEAGVVWA
jgi:hypothetical protein